MTFHWRGRAFTRVRIAGLVAGLALCLPAQARDSLGVFDGWAAFRDPPRTGVAARCYAIAEPESANTDGLYATVSFWPQARVRGQVYFHFARPVSPRSPATLSLDGQRFVLSVRGTGTWARDARMDAAIVAAMRSATSMTVSAADTQGRTMSGRWALRGTATAIDAAALGCARR